MKTRKQIIVCAVTIFLLGGYSLKGQAADTSSVMLNEQNEFKNMLADKGIDQVFIHKEWGTREPFSTNMFHNERSDFVLNGIFIGDSKPSAIINGTVVGVGNKIEGATVEEIKDNSVVLIDEEETKIVLSLKQ